MRKFSRDEEAIRKLSPEQYRVTQQSGTEPPGTGEYLDNHEPGIYVDIVSGEPLFASSVSSNPAAVASFKPMNRSTSTKERHHARHGANRVRSTHADSHLGHVFPDGPKDRGGLRYCINSASLRLFTAMTEAGLRHLRTSGGYLNEERPFWPRSTGAQVIRRYGVL